VPQAIDLASRRPLCEKAKARPTLVFLQGKSIGTQLPPPVPPQDVPEPALLLGMLGVATLAARAKRRADCVNRPHRERSPPAT